MSIYMIGGGKGGVGKSLVSMALIDYLACQEKPPVIIESDTSNPDVGKSYMKSSEVQFLNLDINEGWLDFIEIAAASKNDLVVNLASRSNVAINKYGETLRNALDEIDHDFRTIWVINRQRDSIELALEYQDIMPGRIDILLNGYFGEKEKFVHFNGLKSKEKILRAGGKVGWFPDLGDRVTDEMNIKRLTVAKALEEMSLSSRAELSRWRKEVANTFKTLEI